MKSFQQKVLEAAAALAAAAFLFSYAIDTTSRYLAWLAFGVIVAVCFAWRRR